MKHTTLSFLVATALAAAIHADPVDWTAYKKSFDITFPGYTSSATLTDFPVLIRLSAEKNAFEYAKCPNGLNLRFSDADGNLLSSEIDTWNPGGESFVWVKVPSFNRDTIITAHYGCPSSAIPPEVNPKDVWSNGYVGVWHLGESARPLLNSTSTTDIDFTHSHDNDADSGHYDECIAFATNGAVGAAVGFGTNFGNDSSKDNRGGLLAYDPDGKLSGLDAISIEIWEKVESFDETYDRYMLSKRSDSGDKRCPYYFSITTALRPTSVMQLSNKGTCWVSAWAGYLTQSHAGSWNFHCAQHDKNMTTHTNYLNGVYAGARDDASGNPLISDDAPLCLGNYTLPYYYAGGKPTVFNGALDELRISNVARPNAWVKATYDTVHNADFTHCELPNDWNLYSHKINVTFSGAPESTLTDFPVLVQVSTNDISGFLYTDCLKSNGGDLRFSDSEGNLLDSEVDTWDPDGVSTIWVKVPFLSKDTSITAYYGNKFAPLVDSKAVWSNGYVGVWHLGESARPLKNSTATEGVDFTRSHDKANDPGHYDDCIAFAESGAAGKAVRFSAYTGDDEAMQRRGGLIAYDPQNKLCGFGAISLEIWAKVDAFDTAQRYLLARRVTVSNGSKLRPYNISYTQSSGLKKACSQIGLDNGLDDANANVNHYSGAMGSGLAGSWNYHCFQYDNTATYHTNYLNGAYSTRVSNNTGYLVLAPTEKESFLCLGNDAQPSSCYTTAPASPQVFNGSVDELRISNVARSDAWVKATYDTIKNNDTFATYSSAMENVRATILILR